MSGAALGTVTKLWRYPVKSMGGELLTEAAVGTRGLAGDRGWAIVDSDTGKVASAKRPKLWGPLLEFSARYASEPDPDGPAAAVTITTPSGAEVSSDDPDRDARLSEAVGRAVTLVAVVPEGAAYELAEADAHGLTAENPEALTESALGLLAPGTFFDTCSLHVVAEQSLARMGDSHRDGRWDLRRFRPNVVLDLDADGHGELAENEWVGRSLHVGEVTAAVLAPMPRCVMTTVEQGDLPRDPLILRTIAQGNRQDIPGYGSFACLGAITNVTSGGRLRAGDRAELGDPL